MKDTTSSSKEGSPSFLYVHIDPLGAGEVWSPPSSETPGRVGDRNIDFSNLKGTHSRGVGWGNYSFTFLSAENKTPRAGKVTDSGNLFFTCSYAGGERMNIICMREGAKVETTETESTGYGFQFEQNWIHDQEKQDRREH